MTAGALLGDSLGAAWPYLLVALVGFLPTEVWRLMAVVVAHNIRDDSEILAWARAVSQALIAGVVAKILFAPPGSLALLPAYVIWGAFGFGVGVFFVFKRAVLAALIAGEGMLLVLGLLSNG
jgi:hypothetical protein